MLADLHTDRAPADPPDSDRAPTDRRDTGPGVGVALVPVLVDVALPIGATAVASWLGYGTVGCLTAGGAIPLVRTLGSVLRGVRLNRLAALMLATSIVGVVAGAIVGDPRLIVAKDGLISASIAVGLLLSTRRGTPIMSAGLLPFVTRGEPAKVAAWHRLSAGLAPFRALERRYTAVWGSVLLADCAIRAVGAFVVPATWLPWLGGAVTGAALVVAAIASGAVAVERLTALVEAETTHPDDAA